MSKLRSAMHRGKRVVLDTTETTKPLRKRSKTAVKEEKNPDATPPSTYHTFHESADVVHFRSQLLDWYDKEKRVLPWRTVAMTESDLNISTYAVWVSEVMLQQTQVATVIDYYNKWMKRWPTVHDLAAAMLEEVNQMWAGLGYYSRGKRLHEGAQKTPSRNRSPTNDFLARMEELELTDVWLHAHPREKEHTIMSQVVLELKGQMPRTVDSLLKQLPGVGRYTAAAIGSIALGQVTGAVDGNVIRVLCRVRAIGADSTSPVVTEALWAIANTLVDPERPGDFNQAMMELGARVCSPKGPLCSQCPVQSHCHSYRKVHIKQEQNTKRLLGKSGETPATLPDIEDCMNSGTCTLCPKEPWDNELGVQNFPRKPAKKPPRVERTLTCVVVRAGEGGEDRYMLTQRPSKGLLAGMWEFPSLLLESENSQMKQQGALCAEVGRMLGVQLNRSLLQYVGEVVHIFSHIHQTYVVHSVRLKDSGLTSADNTQWLTRASLQAAAVSTGVKKILKLYDSVESPQEQTKSGQRRRGVKNEPKPPASRRDARGTATGGSRQLSLSRFFKAVNEDA